MGIFRESPSTTVLISNKAYQKQQALIRTCNTEVGWFGTVQDVPMTDGSSIFYVDDIYVPEQVVSGGSVESIGDELMQFLMQHAELADKMRYYGHSHVDFDCFTSGTDLKQILTWKDYDMDFMISYIGNKRNESVTRLDQFKPRHLTSRVDLYLDVDKKHKDWAFKECTDNVEMVKWNAGKHGMGGYEQTVKPKGSSNHLVKI